MRALTTLLSLMMLVSAIPAWAKSPVELSPCEIKLERLHKHFDSVLADLRAMGLKKLLEPLDSGKIKVSYREKNFFWQSNVSWRFGWVSSDKLILRKLKWDTEKQRQKSTWKVALALYNLQAPRRLWNFRALEPNGDGPVFDLSGEGAAEMLEYFLYRYPVEWRDNENGRRTTLNTELKTVLDSLPLVKEPLPKVSRVKFISFWEDHFRRLAIVGAVCMIPKFVDVPRCYNAFEVSAKKQYELVTDAHQQERLSLRYKDILYAEVREDIAELKAQLPNATAQQELDELYRQYPELAKEQRSRREPKETLTTEGLVLGQERGY